MEKIVFGEYINPFLTTVVKAVIPFRLRGLMPVSMGAQVRITDGKLNVVDGPFVETKELIGGYAIFELRDKDEAVAAAVELMQLHKDHMPGWEGTCEVRMFASPEAEATCQVDARVAS